MNRKQRRALEKKGGNPAARQPAQFAGSSGGGTLSHLLARSPSDTGPSIAEAMARGYALYREGRRGAAEKLFDEILARQPDNAESLHMKGVLRYL